MTLSQCIELARTFKVEKHTISDNNLVFDYVEFSFKSKTRKAGKHYNLPYILDYKESHYSNDDFNDDYEFVAHIWYKKKISLDYPSFN